MSNRIILSISILTMMYATIMAQNMDTYIHKAWQINLHLQSQNFELKAAEYALMEAKSMYGPQLGFNTQYTLAAGGRNISFPIGDLLNPAYDALNKLTNSNQFPNLDNTEVNFLPNNFYDAKFRFQQAILYPDLAINKEIKTEQIKIKDLEIRAYKRLVSKEVMTTYYQVLSAREAIGIFIESKILLEEARRTTQSMVNNGIALPSALHRIEAQISSVNAQIIESNNNLRNAQAYFIHLTGDSLSYALVNLDPPPMPASRAINREELMQLDQGIVINKILEKKEGQFYKPKLTAQLDLGSQAFNFGWSPYALLGLNLDINLYDHKRHKFKYDIAKANTLAIDASKSQIQKQLELQSNIQENNLLSALDQIKTFEPRILTSNKIYKEVFIKYKEGIANYLELLDAETQLTSTKIQYTLAKFNAWLKSCEVQYTKGSYKID